MTTEEKELLAHVPSDGSGIGNRTLVKLLRWPKSKYDGVRDALIAKGVLRAGPGAGGSVKRASALHEEQRLQEVLASLGGAVGNVTLLRALGWSENRYYAVRDRLIDQGALQKGPGRGGSVKLVEQDEDDGGIPGDLLEEPEARPGYASEADLYEPIECVLREHWVKDKSFQWSHVANTARQGGRSTGGKWTRPDLTVLSLRRYRYVPGVHLEVWSFEVKTLENLDVSAVYEAVAHARFATRAYVVFPFAEEPSREQAELLAAVEEEAVRHGVGVITMVDPAHYETWEERVTALRSEAEPDRINTFIGQQISADAQSDLQDQLRGS